MGMSSSQARLLSLTGRMHDIEYKAQKLEAQKLQMANESAFVYEKYADALNATKSNAIIMGNDGSTTSTSLTADKIYTYNTLQKQYTLKTQDDKTLIPETIHDVYTNTNTLSEFLEHYGLYTDYTQTIHHKDPNPDYENAVDRFDRDHDNWQDAVDAIDEYNRKLAEYNKKLEEWNNILIPEWETKKPDKNDPKYISTSENLGDKFEEAGDYCYDQAVNDNSTSCYKHVLQHIIDYTVGEGYNGAGGNNYSWYDGTNNRYETSTEEFVTVATPGGGCHNSTNNEIFSEVSTQIDDEELYKVAITEGETCDITEASTDGEKLLSKWNPDGTLKSIKQWAIDLYFLCDKYSSKGITKAQVIASVTDFQEGLAGSMNFDLDRYNKDVAKWEGEKPPKPTPPTMPPAPGPEPELDDYIAGLHEFDEYNTTTTHVTFADKSLTQWYINLWYKLEGLDDVQMITETIVHDDGTNQDVEIYSIVDKNKSNTTYSTNDWSGTLENENYIVIDDNYLSDANWVHNLLEAGLIIIQAFSSIDKKFVDTSRAVDTGLETVQDETELKKAEAEYEASMRKIDAKDKRYDVELASLENERNAINTEMDTLKTVIKDNVDRTFKLFG